MNDCRLNETQKWCNISRRSRSKKSKSAVNDSTATVNHETKIAFHRMLFAASAVASHAALSQTPPPPVVSPDVRPDNTVTLSLPRAQRERSCRRDRRLRQARAHAKRRSRRMERHQRSPHSRYYGYSFIADGVGLLDPSNYRSKPNFLYRANEVHVPGPSLAWESADVPHGEIHHPFFISPR